MEYRDKNEHSKNLMKAQHITVRHEEHFSHLALDAGVCLRLFMWGSPSLAA